MNDAREGIVRLTLPDGRTIPLQLTYQRMDVRGHGWVLEALDQVRRAKSGSSQAVADLLEVLTGGAVSAAEVMAAPAAAFPLGLCTPAIWKAWELAYHGPEGRQEATTPADPKKRRPTLWGWLTGRR